MAGMGLSLWDRVPQGTLSLLTLDFPKGNFPQQSLTPRGSGTALALPVGDLTLPKDPAGSPLTQFHPQNHPRLWEQHRETLRGSRDTGWIFQAAFPTPPGPSSFPQTPDVSKGRQNSVQLLLRLQRCAQHVREDFPAPWEPFRDRAAPAPLAAITTQTLFCRARCAFLAVMCLSVPLFAIQTFPLSLSFGIFFNFSPCRVLGSEGLVAVPCHRSWHRVPSGLGLAGLGSRGSLSRAPRSW